MMSLRSAHRGVLLFALLSGCTTNRPTSGVKPAGGAQARVITGAACAALAVVLDSLGVGQRGEYPVLAKTTIAYGQTQYVPEFFRRVRATQGLTEATWTSFLAHNVQPERACAEAPGHGPAVTTETPFAPWPAIEAAHPKATGVFIPSGVGVAPDEAQVFVLVSVRVSGCGAMRYIALVDRDAAGRWKISSLIDDGGMADCLGPIGKSPGF